jgi:hypothetical protein
LDILVEGASGAWVGCLRRGYLGTKNVGGGGTGGVMPGGRQAPSVEGLREIARVPQDAVPEARAEGVSGGLGLAPSHGVSRVPVTYRMSHLA